MTSLSLVFLIFALVCTSASCADSTRNQRKEAESLPDSEYDARRKSMVRHQIQGRGVTNPAVLDAMSAVPRHRFVSPQWRDHAYADYPLPIGSDQTISQPYIVALMTELLAPDSADKVLEVGTGSGYQAAVLAEIVDSVFSIEIITSLAQGASALLDTLDYTNVLVKAGDGYLGWPEHAPFDGIIVTCAPDDIPAPLVGQLKDGGRMVIPVGDDAYQELYLLKKVGDRIERESITPVRFVPMTGKASE